VAGDSSEVYDDTSYTAEDYPSENSDYQDWYHFHDSEQYAYNQRKLAPKFDRDYWKKVKRGINFEEDTQVVKKEETKKLQKPSKGINLPDFKFPFIFLTLIILGIIIYLLLKNTNFGNKKVQTNILVNFDDLDEQTLKDAELNTPLNTAIRKGDFKTAYRIKYLKVLQLLIGRNLIIYKKEKTNYDYLMQLSGKTVYEPFRSLTFNFDGIWYGELFIDETRYNELLPYFNQFDDAMKSA
jgi:hypothetical protein